MIRGQAFETALAHCAELLSAELPGHAKVLIVSSEEGLRRASNVDHATLRKILQDMLDELTEHESLQCGKAPRT